MHDGYKGAANSYRWTWLRYQALTQDADQGGDAWEYMGAVGTVLPRSRSWETRSSRCSQEQWAQATDRSRRSERDVGGDLDQARRARYDGQHLEGRVDSGRARYTGCAPSHAPAGSRKLRKRSQKTRITGHLRGDEGNRLNTKNELNLAPQNQFNEQMRSQGSFERWSEEQTRDYWDQIRSQWRM